MKVLLSVLDGDQVSCAQFKNKGSSAKGVIVQIQGVPAVGIIDSHFNIAIFGAELFTKVALTAHYIRETLRSLTRSPEPTSSAHSHLID